MKIAKRHNDALRGAFETLDQLKLKLIIECWNAETPHFGGAGPHRYDGREKRCAYCARPKDWKALNSGWWASELLSEWFKPTKKRSRK